MCKWVEWGSLVHIFHKLVIQYSCIFYLHVLNLPLSPKLILKSHLAILSANTGLDRDSRRLSKRVTRYCFWLHIGYSVHGFVFDPFFPLIYSSGYMWPYTAVVSTKVFVPVTLSQVVWLTLLHKRMGGEKQAVYCLFILNIPFLSWHSKSLCISHLTAL